jgi:MFS family permease
MKVPPLLLQKPTRVRFGVLAFACTLSLLTYLDRVCIMRAKEDMQRDLGLTNAQFGLVFSAFLLGYCLFEVPGGWMGDVWGPRRVLTRIVLCWSLFTALTGCIWPFVLDSGYSVSLGSWTVPLLFDTVLAMLLIRFLFGAGEAGAYPNLTRVVSSWIPFRERAVAQGAIWMSARLGGAIAPFVLGRLSVLLGWRLAFAVLGCVGLAWVTLFWWWFRDRPAQKPGCNDAERALIEGAPPPATDSEAITTAPTPARHADRGHAWPPPGQLVSSVTLWGLCLAAACVSFGWYFYPTWQPEYLKDVYHISYEGSELLTGLPFLCGALGCLVGGRLSDRLVVATGSRRWGRSLLGLVGFTGAGLCVLGTGFVREPWQAVALLCLAFLVNDLAIPVIWAVCSDVGGRFAGTVAGIMNMAGGIGGMLSPALIPQVREALQGQYPPVECWRLIFAGLAGAWFIGAAAWLVIDAGRPMFREE